MRIVTLEEHISFPELTDKIPAEKCRSRFPEWRRL